jgi:outer membrane immunogenic protein
MKKLLIAGAALAALIGTPALAADLALKAPPPPVAPMYSWAGFYLGVECGGGWAKSRQTDTFGATSGDYNQSGGLAGGTIGYNWQWGNIVGGLEADMSWAGINGSVNLPLLCSIGGGTVCFTNMHWLNTDRARLGVLVGAQNQFLLYVTGGAAGAEIRSGQQPCAVPGAALGQVASCGTRTEWAGVGGAGVEAMIAPHWSAKLEYLYTNFGTHTFYTAFIPVNVKESNVNIVRAGVNWHF